MRKRFEFHVYTSFIEFGKKTHLIIFTLLSEKEQTIDKINNLDESVWHKRRANSYWLQTNDNSFYTTLLKWQNYENRTQSSAYQRPSRQEEWKGMGCRLAVNSNIRNPCSGSIRVNTITLIVAVKDSLAKWQPRKSYTECTISVLRLLVNLQSSLL